MSNRGEPSGFSEQAMRALDEREGAFPPASAYEGASTSQGRPTPDHRPHYWGHRERLRQRFLKGGSSLPDYEVLEMVLFNAIPRIDVKPLAKALLARFGSLNDVLAAPEHALNSVSGVTPKVYFHFQLFRQVAERLTRNEVRERPLIGSWSELVAYCNVVLANRQDEEFWCLFLNNTLIADEMLGKGTVNHVPVYPRQILKRILELNATAVILLHNHPSGNPDPSSEDIAMTRQILEIGRAHV